MASGIRKRETKGTSHHPNKVKTEIYIAVIQTRTHAEMTRAMRH
jgi:hypothetical protein